MVPGCWTLLVKGYCPSLVITHMLSPCTYMGSTDNFLFLFYVDNIFASGVCFYLILPSLSLRPWLVSAVFPTCMYPFPESPPVLCFIFHVVVRFLALLSLTFLSMFVVFGMVPCHHSDFGLSFWFSGTGSVKACLKFIPVSRILHFCPEMCPPHNSSLNTDALMVQTLSKVKILCFLHWTIKTSYFLQGLFLLSRPNSLCSKVFCQRRGPTNIHQYRFKIIIITINKQIKSASLNLVRYGG